jgi:geranylgeranyl pyrophosphate synthase
MRVQKSSLMEAAVIDTSLFLGQVESKIFSLLDDGYSDPLKELGGAVKAARFHLKAGGSRVRARIGLHSGLALGLTIDDCVTLSATSELLHNASLIHDDLQDRDTERRGAETVWLTFGDNIAICTGDLLISLSYGCLSSFSNTKILPELFSLVNSRTCEAIYGQCADLRMQGTVVKDIELYKQIVAAKSGALLSLPLELSLVSSENKINLQDAKLAVRNFAIGYQIADDIADVDRDAGSSDTPNSLNIVHVIKAAGHGAASTSIARNIGKEHLAQACDSAALLPHGCGDFLVQLASKLAAQL